MAVGTKVALKKKKTQEKSLINTCTDELPKNSKVIGTILKGTTALVSPISKSIDYVIIGTLSIVVYNLVNNYLI
jgi:hypothetical protein